MRLSGKRWSDNLSIRTRLTALFALVSLIPLCVIGAVSLNVSSETLTEKGVQDSLSRLEFIAYRTGEIIRDKHGKALMAAFNPYVRAYYDENRGGLTEANSLIEDQAKRQIIRLYNSQEALSVYLVAADGRALKYSGDYSAVQSMQLPERPVIALSRFRLFDEWGAATTLNGERVIPYERVVLAGDDNAPVALIRINVRESLFRDLYREYELDRGTRFFLIDGAGRIESCTEPERYGLTAEEALGFTLAGLPGESGFLRVGPNVFTYYKDTARARTFVERIPAAALNAGFAPIVRITLLVAVLSFALCLALATLMSHSFTKPLFALIDRVSSVDGSPALGIGRRNEIDILSDRYGEILARLEKLIGEYYEEQEKKKHAQIQALEFQINPHFLYNTLSTIIWLIDAGEGKKAIRITKNLSQFFRISISKGRDYISIREEIKHVELYIDIQMARYAGSLSVRYAVPEELRDYLTPKLVLQPLVENSIQHALRGRSTRRLGICLTAEKVAEDILLRVIDDGDGMTKEKAEEMNRFLDGRDRTGKGWGIGISNVNDRVAMCFGEGYGLRYSRSEEKTVATIRIRAMKGNEGT